MGRYINTYTSTKTQEQLAYIADDFFAKEGFKTYDYKGETVFKLGSGWLSAPQFIKLNIVQNQVHIEAFLKYPVLPGVYVGEMSLKGFWGFAMKKILLNRVQNLERLLA